MLVPSDIEADVVAFLTPHLPGVTVATEVPRDRPDRIVVVSATGGWRRNLVQVNPTVLVEAWAPDTVSARDLAARVWSLMTDEGAEWPPHVVKANPDLPRSYPDALTTNPRYQFLATILTNLEVRP